MPKPLQIEIYCVLQIDDMKYSTIKKSTYKAIYRLLDRVSPLKGDCGKLCGAACCTCGGDGEGDDFDLGIYLLPGEEKLFTGQEDWLKWSKERAEDYEFPNTWRGYVYFVRCKNAPHCPRELRPLQCRFFPLAPHLTSDGVLHLVRFTGELPYECPLIRDEMELEPRFIKATYTVWKHLIRDPLIRDLVELDSWCRQDEELVFMEEKVLC